MRLFELANQPYEYEELAAQFNILYKAMFETESGIKYVVAFLDSETEEGDQSVGVEFRAYTSSYDFKGTQKITKSGNAFRVFATVAEIVARFLAFNPEFKNINFAADKSEPSRVKLYNTMTKMMPKFVPSLRFVGIEDDNKYKHYHFTLKDKATTQEGIEQINELANQPYDLKVYDDDYDSQTTYKFTTEKGSDYYVIFENIVEDNMTSIHVEFKKDTPPGTSNQGILNTGDAFRVFATVAAAIKKQLLKVPADEIHFMSKRSEPSRVKLYDQIAKMLPKHIPEFKFESKFVDPNVSSYYTYVFTRQ